jgi:hypothetical protein
MWLPTFFGLFRRLYPKGLANPVRAVSFLSGGLAPVTSIDSLPSEPHFLMNLPVFSRLKNMIVITPSHRHLCDNPFAVTYVVH